MFTALWLYGLMGVDAAVGLLALMGAPVGGWEAGVFLLMSAGWLFYFAVTRDG